jgi:hypothetical protein
MKIGDLVKYSPNPSTLFKWQTHLHDRVRRFGIVVEHASDPILKDVVIVQWCNGKRSTEETRLLKIISES